MATPGGVAVLPNSVNKVDSPSSSSSSSSSTKAVVCVRSSEVSSPILIFLFFHKAIRNELDALHRSAVAFATGKRSDIRPLLERYHFLRSVYKHHSNAEDEVHFLWWFVLSAFCLFARKMNDIEGKFGAWYFVVIFFSMYLYDFINI